MIALAIGFSAGAFHARPWHADESASAIGWPLSPWELLAALVGAWTSTRAFDAAILMRLCDKLASAPRFVLPPLASARRRFLETNSSQHHDDLALDCHVPHTEREATAFVVWDVATATSEERRLLDLLCDAVVAFGPNGDSCALSVVDRVPEPETDRFGVDLVTRVEHEFPGAIVRRLGVDANFRGRGLIAALASREDQRTERGAVPRGATWLEYQFPSDYGRDRIDGLLNASRAELGSCTLRFRITAPRPKCLASVTDTLVFAELFRHAVLSAQGARGDARNTSLFTGKTLEGVPLTGENHAYFLPRDEDGDGRLDVIDVHLPRAFSHEEYRALTSVTRLFGRPLQLAADEFLSVSFVGEAPPTLGRRWRSISPFVLPRYPKMRGKEREVADAPIDQIRRELSHRAYNPAEISVERGADAVIAQGRERYARADSFRRVRERAGKSDGPPREAVTATLTFDEPVQGPIAIGRYAHFGLGQFVPIDDGA
jgi:CRISPR-associated protein Csb2